jgi:Putative MetA-pathway of phenol degradation
VTTQTLSRMTGRIAFFAASALFTAAASGQAQTVSDVLTFLVTNQSVATGSIDRDREAAIGTSDTISKALLANLATLPVTASSGAFVYRLNPELGTVERATQSFGPFFTERALTAGRHQASLGMTFQHLHFTSLDGRNLRDGSLVTVANQFSDEAAPFDVDALTLNIDASVATLYGNLGITDDVEIGFAAPFVALMLDGSRINTYRGRTFTQATATARATGLADLVVRAKYTVVNEDSKGLALAADVRLPTGRREDLLGAGTTSLKVSGIGSVESGVTSVHANAGMTFGGLTNEISYGGAFTVNASGRVSVIGELLGRWIDSPGHITAVSAEHPRLAGVQTIRLTPDDSTLNLIMLVPGFKWNLADTWVLAGNVTVPLTHGGLTAPFTPFIGLDYSLGR